MTSNCLPRIRHLSISYKYIYIHILGTLAFLLFPELDRVVLFKKPKITLYHESFSDLYFVPFCHGLLSWTMWHMHRNMDPIEG